MPSQIDKAKKEYPDLNFFVGNVLDTHLDSDKFDTDFVFGILHHIPQWKMQLKNFIEY